MLDESFYQKADEIIANHTKEERSLIPIIQDIQAEYRYLPPELLTYVAKEIGISQAQVSRLEKGAIRAIRKEL